MFTETINKEAMYYCYADIYGLSGLARWIAALFSRPAKGAELRRGCRDAVAEAQFQKVVGDYRKVINGICFSYASDPADLEDLRQDIYLNIWRGLQQFKGESSMSTWIYRVALNTCVSTVRKRSRSVDTLPIDKCLECGDTDDDRDYQERVESLYAMIACLSPVEKAIVTMWLDGNPYEEIAEVVGLSKNNVGIRLHRIKEKLAVMAKKI